MAMKYRRILLKLSGEALGGDAQIGIDAGRLAGICGQIQVVKDHGVQTGVVVGGGNFFRGVDASTMDRVDADYIGMLATVMNALAMGQELARIGAPAQVMSAIPMAPVCESYDRSRAVAHLESGRVVVFAAGTGNPFFSTDTAASLRALEIGADILLKATKVDGVYSKDPVKHPDAERYTQVSYDAVLENRLAVMDATAIALCREHELPLRVFSMMRDGGLERIINGDSEGTLVSVR
ncbi:MAG: UMP kinase [Gammaproteobacteria bacterium]|nr:UMP kinase [Gammaproteobacteria bacterium]